MKSKLHYWIIGLAFGLVVMYSCTNKPSSENISDETVETEEEMKEAAEAMFSGAPKG